MPVHDWTKVDAGIFHDFHHSWTLELKRSLNAGLLPPEYYALAEQRINPLIPDVLTLKAANGQANGAPSNFGPEGGGVLLAPPKRRPIAESDLDVYRRKQNRIAIRHVSEDDLVGVIEIVSPGNKSSRDAIREFISKAIELFMKRIHVFIIDLVPPTRRDPQGIHGAIWEEFTDQPYAGPPDKPFTVASYEVAMSVRAFVERFAVGDELPEMPLFLRPDAQIPLPLEQTYRAAWDAVPRRWRTVLESAN